MTKSPYIVNLYENKIQVLLNVLSQESFFEGQMKMLTTALQYKIRKAYPTG